MRLLPTALVLAWLGAAAPARAQEIALESPRRTQWGYLGPGIASTTLGVGLAAGMAAAFAGTGCLGCSGERRNIEVPVFLGTAALGGIAVGVPLIFMGLRGVPLRPGAPLTPSRSAYMGAGIASTVIGVGFMPVLAIVARPSTCVANSAGSGFSQGGPCPVEDGRIAGTVRVEPILGPTQLGLRGTF